MNVEYFVVTPGYRPDRVNVLGQGRRARRVQKDRLGDVLTDRRLDRALVGWKTRAAAERHAVRDNATVIALDVDTGKPV